tara:strand:- start:125 stop:1432 length:1308 start_codon:yes stop_codon:yes gene_type:complete
MKNKKFYFETLPSYIIVLMPVFLITGPFLSDLGLSIVAILFLVNSKINNLSKYYNNIYFKLFFIFWIILILSSLFSENIISSLRSSLFYFRFAIFSLCLWYIIEKNENILKRIFYSITICFLSLIVDGYIQYFFGKNLLGIEIYGNNRVSSFFGSELILGSYLSRFFPILFGLFVFINQKSKIKSKNLLILITATFILTEGLILLSGERVALFFMNMSAIYILLMINDYKKYRFWTYIGSLLLILALLFLFPQTKNRIIQQTINDFTTNPSSDPSSEKNDGKIYIFTKAHNDMYITGIKIFKDNKLLGVGPRQYRNNCKEYGISKFSCQGHPHNTYIELLSEAGIFAFMFVFITFLFIVTYSVIHFFKYVFKRKNLIFNDFEVCILSAILISLWPLVPTGSFFNNWMSIVYYFPVGMFLWQRSKNTINPKNIKNT